MPGRRFDSSDNASSNIRKRKHHPEESQMSKVSASFGFSVTFGTFVIASIMASTLAGCSMFSASNAPVDCDVVKTQQQAGKTDAQIASDLSAPEDKVAACHGPETSGNKAAGGIPSNY
jgi:hypothetical protein